MKENRISNAQHLYEALRSEKHVCVAPMGDVGRHVCDALKRLGITPECFLDRDSAKWGISHNGVVCRNPEDCVVLLEGALIILATGYYNEISEYLTQMGAKNIVAMSRYKIDFIKSFSAEYLEEYEKKLDKLKEYMADEESVRIVSQLYDVLADFNYLETNYEGMVSSDQYFDEVISVTDNEFFVDIGAFEGDTIKEFLEKSQYRFGAIYGFELDKRSYEVLMYTLDALGLDERTRDKIHLCNKGVYSKPADIYYDSDTVSSEISTTGVQSGKVVTLDEALCDSPVTFIKMDIEGSEMEALRGAVSVLKKNKPKLAISVYHKPEDLYEIPFFLKQLIPEYRLYIRHYSPLEYETVLYAIADP